MVVLDDPRIGSVTLPASVPMMSATPPQLRHTGRAMGTDTDEVLRSMLGLDATAIAGLRNSGAI